MATLPCRYTTLIYTSHCGLSHQWDYWYLQHSKIICMCQGRPLWLLYLELGGYQPCDLQQHFNKCLLSSWLNQFGESSYIMLFLWFQYQMHFQRLRWFIDPPILKTLYSVFYHMPNSPACMIHWTFSGDAQSPPNWEDMPLARFGHTAPKHWPKNSSAISGFSSTLQARKNI